MGGPSVSCRGDPHVLRRVKVEPVRDHQASRRKVGCPLRWVPSLLASVSDADWRLVASASSSKGGRASAAMPSRVRIHRSLFSVGFSSKVIVERHDRCFGAGLATSTSPRQRRAKSPELRGLRHRTRVVPLNEVPLPSSFGLCRRWEGAAVSAVHTGSCPSGRTRDIPWSPGEANGGRFGEPPPFGAVGTSNSNGKRSDSYAGGCLVARASPRLVRHT